MGFKRTKEDFTCEHCGAVVVGTGYTNHCPKCLRSRHVDIEPGDRAEVCGGMMEPSAVEGSTPRYRLIHTCTRCGIVRWVDVASNDDPNTLLALIRKRVS